MILTLYYATFRYRQTDKLSITTAYTDKLKNSREISQNPDPFNKIIRITLIK